MSSNGHKMLNIKSLQKPYAKNPQKIFTKLNNGAKG